MNKNEMIELKQKIDKLIYALDYDRDELNILRAEIQHILSVDVETNDKKTLLDKIFISLLKTKNKNFRPKKYEKIRNAIQSNDDAALIDAINYDTDIFVLRENTTDLRYNVKNLLKTPGSNFAPATIIYAYKMVETEWTDLKTIARDIKSYLERKYISEIELNQ